MDGLKEFSYDELRSATLEFTAVLDLGDGRKQWWYRACIPGCGLATVKRFRDVRRSTLHAVAEEVRVHRSLRGRESPFIAKMLGYCAFERDPLLVYEFVPPGDCTLQECLESSKLKWTTRLKIAANITAAVQALHGTAGEGRPAAPVTVYLRDLKAGDILLEYSQARGSVPEPRILNFGGAVVLPNRSRGTTIHTRPSFERGPHAYTDPFYVKTGQMTEKTDVYSVGVLLLELLTGLSAGNALPPSRHGAPRTLVALATETCRLDRLYEYGIVDPGLDASPACRASVVEVARLATRCCAGAPRARPSMAAVSRALERVLAAAHFRAPPPPSPRRALAEEWRESGLILHGGPTKRRPSPVTIRAACPASRPVRQPSPLVDSKRKSDATVTI